MKALCLSDYLQYEIPAFLPEIYHGLRLLGEGEDAFGADAMAFASVRDRQVVFVKENGLAAGVGQFHQVLPAEHSAF